MSRLRQLEHRVFALGATYNRIIRTSNAGLDIATERQLIDRCHTWEPRCGLMPENINMNQVFGTRDPDRSLMMGVPSGGVHDYLACVCSMLECSATCFTIDKTARGAVQDGRRWPCAETVPSLGWLSRR